MENPQDKAQREVDDQARPSAPALEDEQATSSSSSAHKLENLKMTQVKAGRSQANAEPHNEWTVVYSDSNSSVLSGVEDDEEENIDISVVDEEIIEKDGEEEYEDEGDEEMDEFEEDEEEAEVPKQTEAFVNADLPLLKKLDEINIGGGIGESTFQIWEQSVDSTTADWIKPLLVSKLGGDHGDSPPSPPPSFADNEYESSDIDIINDDEDYGPGGMMMADDASILSMSMSSVISQSTNLSFLREQYLQAHLSKQANNRRGLTFKYFSTKDSASNEASDDEVSSDQQFDPAALSKVARIRAYVHTPNTGLNGKLNLILILTVAAVVGLGIGHFIGWSNQWRQQKQLSMGQVIKLKQLQDDLLVCMKSQDIGGSLNDESGQYVQDHYKVCLRDSDYWKERIETLFNENKGLIELFQRTQKHFRENGDHAKVIEEHECVNKTTSEEFHKLKLNLLVNQMEHFKLLEVLEEVKEENEDLKKKLVEEEEDDQELEQTWGNRVAVLQTENEELRKTIVDDDAEDMKVLGALKDKIDAINRENVELRNIIEQLEKQMIGVTMDSTAKWNTKPSHNRGTQPSANVPVDGDGQSGYIVRYNALRDRINQMMSENEELKAKIARYRWTSTANHQKKGDDEEEGNSRNDDNERSGKFDKKGHKQHDEDERKMAIMKAKITVLHHQLQIEQNDSKRWKEKFDSLLKKMNQMNEKANKQEEQKKKDQRDEDDDDDSSSDESDDEDDEDYEEERQHKKSKSPGKDQYKYKSKWDSFHSKWHQKFESISSRSKKFLNSFYEKMRSKWNKFHKKYSKVYTKSSGGGGGSDGADAAAGAAPLNGDKLIKFGQFLENAIENVHNFSESLFHKGMRSEVVTYLTDRMSDFTTLLEKNLNFNRKTFAAHKQQQQHHHQPRSPPTTGEEQVEYYPPQPSNGEEQSDGASHSEWSGAEHDQMEDEELEDLSCEEQQHHEDGNSIPPSPPPPYPAMNRRADWARASRQAHQAGHKQSEEDKRNWLAERAKAREKYRRLRYQANFMN